MHTGPVMYAGMCFQISTRLKAAGILKTSIKLSNRRVEAPEPQRAQDPIWSKVHITNSTDNFFGKSREGLDW